jgi:outer membrane protein OmpA-like peptidoglycan-associated protein
MSVIRIDARVAAKAVVALGLVGAAPHWAAGQGADDGCKLWTQLKAAVKAGDLNGAAAAEREIRGEPDCNRRAVESRKVMLDLYRVQDARLEREKAPPGARLAQLEAALKYGNPWNAWDIHVKIGNLRRKLPDANGKLDHAKISLAYDRAVVAIDKAPASQRPALAEIGRLSRLAYQFEALSATPVTREGPFTRDVLRQINVGFVPAPLQFEYDKAELTEAGKVQAQNLLKQLRARDMPQLHLVGHTDPVGSDSYNDDLSIRRAIAVKDFLVAGGYPASRITTAGRGKRDVALLKIEDRAAFTEEQIHQMLRRVELKMKDSND